MRLAGAALLLVSVGALAAPAGRSRLPACELLVAPDVLSAHSRHAWRLGAPLMLKGDIAVCNYYQEDVPAGLAVSVRHDPEKRDFENARELYGRHATAAPDLPGEAFFYRHPAAAPFAPSWGLVVHKGHRTFRVEGIPEADNAEQARQLAREIIERALARFAKT
jgi:hypothetical protein